jgi:RNA polymerase sigma factor (sigma-70 family)
MSAKLLTRLRTAVGGDPAPDRDLLRAFLAERSEPAFAELVRRHGPMVLGVCRRVLGNPHDADDAFQAAFLVLARKARSVAQPDRLPGWLHAVAVRTATEVRRMRDRRRQREQASGRREPAEDVHSRPAHAGRSPEQSELAALLDEELARLPEHYRLAVVLCELEGRPRKESATRLGIPEGTLSSRLAKAKRLLADRLTKRGVTATAATVAAVLGQAAAARVPGSRVIELASLAPSSLSAVATHTAEGVVKAMFVTKLLKGLTATVGVLVLGLGGAALVPGTAPGHGGAGHGAASAAAPKATADEPATLVRQLGSPAFAVRQAAEKKLRALGPRAKSAVRAGLTSEVPETARRCEAILKAIRREQFWPRFAKLIGDDADARALYGAILSLPRNVELIEAAEERPKRAAKLYADREKELEEKCTDRSDPKNTIWHPQLVTAAEMAGFLYLGTFPGAEKVGGQRNSFLMYDRDMWQNTAYPFSAALKAGPLNVGAGRLLVKWTETRFGRRDFPKGLNGAMAFGLKEMVPAAKQYLLRVKPIGYEHALCLAVIGKLGTKEDIPFLAKFADDRTEATGFYVDYPGDNEPRGEFRPGKDCATQMRDTAVAMTLVLSGQTREQLDEFGFFASRYMPRGPVGQGPPPPLPPVGRRRRSDDPFSPTSIGFIHDADREAAHKKARAFLDKQKQKK